MKFTPLEHDILFWIANRSKEDALVRQLMDARPTKREFSGVGSFTSLQVPDGSLKLTKRVYSKEGPAIKSPELERGGGCVLFTEDGLLKALEIFTFAHRFPQVLRSWTLVELPERQGEATQ